jgi:surface antigen
MMQENTNYGNNCNYRYNSDVRKWFVVDVIPTVVALDANDLTDVDGWWTADRKMQSDQST